MAVKRELIATKPISEFGELDQTLLDTPDATAPDMTYTPGWSDLKHQRDVELAEYTQGTRAGKDVSALPGHLRLVRRMSVGGQVDGKKLMSAANTGGRPVTKDDIGKVPWLTAMPPGARELPDGTIVNAAGDCQYMWWDAKQAAVNLHRKTRRWQEQSGVVADAGKDISDEGLTFRDIRGRNDQPIVDSTKPSEGKSVKR